MGIIDFKLDAAGRVDTAYVYPQMEALVRAGQLNMSQQQFDAVKQAERNFRTGKCNASPLAYMAQVNTMNPVERWSGKGDFLPKWCLGVSVIGLLGLIASTAGGKELSIKTVVLRACVSLAMVVGGLIGYGYYSKDATSPTFYLDQIPKQ